MFFEDISIFSSGILFKEAEPQRPSWISHRLNFRLFRSRSHLVATEQVSAQINQRFGKRCQKLIFKMAIWIFCWLSFSYFVSTRCPNAPHQVSIHLNYIDVQNINSQHFFPYKCLGPIQMHGEANVSLP